MMSILHRAFGMIAPVIFLTVSFLVAPSQSESVTSTPKPGRTQSDESRRRTKFLVGEKNKYLFVFESSYEGKLGGYLPKEKSEMMRARISGLKNFTEHLNEAGEEGYKIISALPTYEVAIMKTDETQYEFRLFETTGSAYFAKSGLKEKLEDLSQLGFRLVEHSQLFTSCAYIDSENPASGENCEYTDRFIAEKEKEKKKPREQILASTFPGWGAKPSVDLEKHINEKLGEGFYPVMAISKFEILFEKEKDKSENLDEKPDVKIIRSGWGKNLQKEINELAKQGFRLALTNNGIAVLYRNRETAQTPVSYHWLRADKKGFEKELINLQNKGTVYRTTYPNQHGTRNTLIFEQGISSNSKHGEFRILQFEFSSVENKPEGKVFTDLTPSSKEAVTKMNQLAEEGFVVRDLFYADGVKVILERLR